jgi:hypothetical protein
LSDTEFRYSPPDSEGWWRGRAHDDKDAEPKWFLVHKDPRFGALLVTVKGRDGEDQDVPVQVVPCVWAGPFQREDVA